MAQQLRGTFGIGTAGHGFVLFFDELTAAGRTIIRQLINLRALLMMNDREHLGNDLTRFAYLYGIADRYAELTNKILIMERGAGYGRTRQKNRLEDADRRDCSCSADVDLNIEQFCLFFFGRLFIGFRPTREFCGTAEQCTVGKVIQLDHRTVDIARQIASVFVDTLYLSEYVIDIIKAIVESRGES